MTTKLSYSKYPYALIFISSKNETLIPIPFESYSLSKSARGSADKLTFRCKLESFIANNISFNEIFASDGRSGRFIVELYSGYSNNLNLFSNNNGTLEYSQKAISELKNEENLRFYGLVDAPELNLSTDSFYVNFEASDITYYLDQLKIVKVFKNYTAVKLIEELITKFNLSDLIRISPSVNTEKRIGQRSSKKDSDEDFNYTAKNKSVWKIIQDCAEHLGETVRVQNRHLQIGFEQPDVNDFQYTMGENCESFNMKRNEKLADSDVYVEVARYDSNNKRIIVGSAGKYTQDVYDMIINSSKSKDSTGTQGNKFIKTKVYRYYLNNIKSTEEANKIAQSILKNILYKRWQGKLKVYGNPYLQCDDKITIGNFLGGKWNDFDNIKWYVDSINETYTLDGSFSSDVTLRGFSLLGNFEGLQSEAEYNEYSSDRQFTEPVDGSGTGESEEFKRKDNSIFSMPSGRITSNYGNRVHPTLGVIRHHDGIDYAKNSNDPIYPAFDGTVVFAGVKGGYGNTVMVKDEKTGIVSLYGHLNKINVTNGQKVGNGNTIGLAGSSGQSSGPHLHFETRLNGQHINPRLAEQKILKSRGVQ